MPLYSRLPRPMGYLLEALLPCLVMLSLTISVIVKVDTGAALARQSRRNLLVACQTARDQADSTLTLFEKAVHSGPRKNDPKLKVFFGEYAAANAATYERCLKQAR